MKWHVWSLCHCNKHSPHNHLTNISKLLIFKVYFTKHRDVLWKLQIERRKDRINTIGSGDSSVPTKPRKVWTPFSLTDHSYRYRPIGAAFTHCFPNTPDEPLLQGNRGRHWYIIFFKLYKLVIWNCISLIPLFYMSSTNRIAIIEFF